MASKIVVNLDTSKENYFVARCKQNDDLNLEGFIYENGEPLDLTNKEIIIQALKADNTYVIQNTDIDKEENKINANLVRDFSRVPGTTKIEIVLTESSKQNTTFSFCLEVVGSVIKGAVESSNTVTILEGLQGKIEEAGKVRDETEQLIESGGAATKGEIQEVNAHLAEIAKKQTIYNRNRNTGRILANKGAFKTLDLGDSIANGSGASEYSKIWAYQLQLKLQAINNNMTNSDFHVRNNGVGGQTIANVVNYISYDLDVKKNPKKSYWSEYKNAVIMTGRNDWQTLSLIDFEYLYRMTVRQLKNNNIDVICCSEPPKLDMSSGDILDGIEVVSGKVNNYYEYKEIIKKIAEDEGVSFVDIWEEFRYKKEVLKEDIRNYSSDGTHPNDSGHALISDLILEVCKGISTPNNRKIDDFEELERRFIPQYIYQPTSTNNATLEDVETVTSYTSRTQHTGETTKKVWRIASGGSVTYPISFIENRLLLITVIMKKTTGKVQVQCPSGLTIDTRTIMNPFIAEHTYLLKPNNVNYPPNANVVITAVDGDVYMQNITVLSPYLATTHSKINCDKTGTWTEGNFSTSEDSLFLRSSNIGDKLTISWFGTNILFNIAKGLNNGKLKITTDGNELGIYDRYLANNFNFTDQIGHIRPLNLGFHVTEIEVMEKNSLSSGNYIGVKGVNIFTSKTSSGSFISRLGENIESYTSIENFNLIEGNVKIINNIAKSDIDTIMKLSYI